MAEESTWKIINGKPTPDGVPDLPQNLMIGSFPDAMWRIDGHTKTGLPFTNLMIECPEKIMTKPYPDALWRIDELKNDVVTYTPLLIEDPDLGAFANAAALRRVSIPKSVKMIGKKAFRNTRLRSVTIAKDCTYYPTSFPEGCTVKFYE